MSHFPGQILGCASTICLYGQISVSCTIPSGLPCPPSHVLSYTFSVIIIIIIYSLRVLADGFSLESVWHKSPQVSTTPLRILAVLSNAVIWIVSTRPPTSKSFRPFNNHLVNLSKAPITIATIVTFMFHNFFNSLARSRYLSFFSHSFRFILWSAGTAKSTILQILYFFFVCVDYY